MNFVEPIRDRKKIAQIKNLLRGQKRYRDLLLFVVGINTALRISDLLQLQINLFLDEQGRIRRRFWVKECKRGKRHEIVINTNIREVLDEYLAAFPYISESRNNFVFFSSSTNDYSISIKRGQAWKFITSICREVGLSGNFGTHSLRKTWGYHARISGVDLALIMYKLNDESIAYTKWFSR